jgi:hypothetical protein
MEGNRSQWIKNQQKLLDLELQAEEAQLTDKIISLSSKNCELEGLSLLNLEAVGTHSELFGRCAVVLQKIGKHSLPNGFKVGDEVVLYNPKLKLNNRSDGAAELFGIVKRVSQLNIDIVIEEYDEQLLDSPLRLDRRSSMKTHSKMKEALEQLLESPHPLGQLVFSEATENVDALFAPQGSTLTLEWQNQGLNESQQKAVSVALQAPRIAVIHGPVIIIVLHFLRL